MRKRMRELRKAKGISLADLGAMIGKSKQTMSGIERGVISLNYDIAVKIAGILGGTPDEIFLPEKSNLILPNSPTATLTEQKASI